MKREEKQVIIDNLTEQIEDEYKAIKRLGPFENLLLVTGFVVCAVNGSPVS